MTLTEYLQGMIENARDLDLNPTNKFSDHREAYNRGYEDAARNLDMVIIENGFNGLAANLYQGEALRTSPFLDEFEKVDPWEQDAVRVFALYHAIFGLTSEAGEAAGILQKTFQGHPEPLDDAAAKEHMLKELGDCLWMISEAAWALGVNLEQVMTMNMDKLRARYPEGFDPERSLHRAEGDI